MDPVRQTTPVQPDSRFSMKYSNGSTKKYLLGGLAIVIGLILYVWITSPMVVTVTGTGEVAVPAESATLSFSVSGSDATPNGAINAVKTRANAIRATLVSSGIAESDIAESQIRVVPASAVTQGATGFQAVITMGAKTVHVADNAGLIANLYSSGASLVSQPVISVDNKSELEQQAFEAAMKDAKKQAGAIALKNLKLIRKVVAVSQVTSPSTSTVTSKGETTAEATQSDTFKIVKAVSVSYKMW